MSAYDKYEWEFRRTTNTICFNANFGNGNKGGCAVTVNVKILKNRLFSVDYVNHYHGTTESEKEIDKQCHPLYQKSITDQDESMFEGVIVSANMMTYHMIQCLMCDDTDKSLYGTGCRPFNHYCGEVMRALTELEI